MDINIPKVTIISGYYNRENDIEESIKSLLNQTYKNIKFIIFDDCSTDNTYEKLKRFENKDDRIHIIKNNENLGFVSSLIRIIKEVETDFIAIHGSGDISLPTRIEKQMKFLEKHSNVGLVGTIRGEEQENDVIKEVNNKVGYVSTDDIKKVNPLTHGSALFRKAAYISSGGYRDVFTFAQDLDLWLRMSLITDIYIIPEMLYIIKRPIGTVSRTLDKLTFQIMFAHFSVQMIDLRVKNGYDLIDIYKENSVLFFNPKSVKKKFISYLMVEIIAENKKNVDFLFMILKFIDKSLCFQLILAVIKNICLNNLLRKLFVRILKMKYKLNIGNQETET